MRVFKTCWCWSATFVLTLALYTATLAPGVLWQDSGMAQVRVLQRDLFGGLGLALSHPLYYSLAVAFQSLPFGESAYKTNLVSAVFGAVTVANVFLLVWLITGRPRGAIVASLSLAVAHTFWQHCVLAEVYTVTTALLTAELLLLAAFMQSRKAGLLVLLFLVNGLGISNHMLAVLSGACYAGLLGYLLIRRQMRPRLLAAVVPAWLLGAGLYLALIAARLMAGVEFGSVIRSALFGEAYADNVLNLWITPRGLLNSAAYIGLNFPTPAIALVPIGILALKHLQPRPFAVLLGSLLCVHLLWAVRYNVPDQYTFFIPSVALLAVVLGLGADHFMQRRPAWLPLLLAAAVLPVFVYLPLPAVARAIGVDIGVKREVPYRDELSYFLHPWKTAYRGPEQFARAVEAALPDDALLFADSTTVSPLHYMQLTGQWRRGIAVTPSLPSTHPGPSFTEATARRHLLDGRLFVVSPIPGYCPPWLLEKCTFLRVGPVFQVQTKPADTAPSQAD